MLIRNLREEIYWGLLLLMIVGTIGIGTQFFFILTAIYYFWMILCNKGRILIPTISGIKMYIVFIVYATIVGLSLYSFRYVIRDLYYVLPTLLWILIGLHLRKRNVFKKKDIFKTLYLYGAVVSSRSIVAFMLNPTFDFDEIRLFFGVGVYDVGFILPILVTQVLLLKEQVFSTKIDRLIIFLMTLQIGLSFGRIAIFQPILELVVLIILIGRYRTEQKRIAVRTLGLIAICTVIGGFVYKLLPTEELNIFLDKIDYVFTEIDSNQTISSTTEAMKNWRGYEMQAAQEQWIDSGVLCQLFGGGLGKGIHIDYIPANWDNIVVENEIPLLHNGFYTLLAKGGLFAVVALVLINISCFKKGLNHSKRHGFYGIEGFVLVGIIVAGLANTYVVRGPVQQGAFLVWGLLVGYLNAEKKVDTKGENL